MSGVMISDRSQIAVLTTMVADLNRDVALLMSVVIHGSADPSHVVQLVLLSERLSVIREALDRRDRSKESSRMRRSLERAAVVTAGALAGAAPHVVEIFEKVAHFFGSHR